MTLGSELTFCYNVFMKTERGVEFVKDKDGRYRSIYLERQPKDQASIIRLQKRIKSLFEDPLLVRESHLHLTWWYLGRPEDIEKEILDVSPDLGSQRFKEAFCALLVDLKMMPARSWIAYGMGFNYLGEPFTNSLVLELRKTQRMTRERRRVTRRVETFIRDCGISDPKEFMQTSSNFKYQVDDRYSPHTTLARVDKEIPLDILRIPPVKICFHHPQLRNVNFSL